MRKKFKIFIIIFFLLLNANLSFSDENFESNEIKACKDFYQAIKSDELPFLKGIYPSEKWDDFGFYIKRVWDTKNQEWINELDNQGNLKVGEIYSYEVFNKINLEDSILRINDKKISSAEEFNQIYSDDINEIKVELRDKNGESYSIDISKHYNEYSYLFYSLINLNITDIDLKKSFYETSIDQAFQYQFNTVDNLNEENHEFVQLAKKYLIGKFNPDDEDFFHICKPTLQQMKDYEIGNPLDFSSLNIIRDDNDLKEINFKITPYAKPVNVRDELRIEGRIKNVQQVKNYFNLKSFPFDKQILQYQIVNNSYGFDTRQFYPQQFVYDTLNDFMAKDDIPGWSKEKYSVNRFFYRDTVDPLNFGRHGISIEIEIERKHGYYIFKVILPIVLILIVCWSVVWIDPREIEARLTITIVCLLSLIAYNFVIDEELPKLEYLTVMDWIVLTSYVYATIPNFLSIYSFKNKSNSILTSKVDALSKRFGITSYIAIILLIIFLNANLNPDNSSAFIGWMAFR